MKNCCDSDLCVNPTNENDRYWSCFYWLFATRHGISQGCGETAGLGACSGWKRANRGKGDELKTGTRLKTVCICSKSATLSSLFLARLYVPHDNSAKSYSPLLLPVSTLSPVLSPVLCISVDCKIDFHNERYDFAHSGL